MKCEFNKSSIKFLGHIIDKDGIRADPDKTSAISRSVSDLRRFMGLVNQLGKFSARIADIEGADEQSASVDLGSRSREVIQELTKPTTLAQGWTQRCLQMPHPLDSVLCCCNDNLMIRVGGQLHMPQDTEKRYAQIEKEALATTWACEKFSMYILGRSFLMETDHKPLVPLLNTKHLDNLPPRVLRFRLRLAKYDFVASYIPGKLPTPSHAPQPGKNAKRNSKRKWTPSLTMLLFHQFQQLQSSCKYTGKLRLRMLSVPRSGSFTRLSGLNEIRWRVFSNRIGK